MLSIFNRNKQNDTDAEKDYPDQESGEKIESSNVEDEVTKEVFREQMRAKIPEIDRRIERILRESFLQDYMKEKDITDISFNGTTLMIQDNKKGRYKADKQPDYNEVVHLGKRIADVQGKEFTNSNPILDTEIAHYRVNFIHDSISPSGVTFSLRISRPILAINNLAEMANDDVAKLLGVLIKAEFNTIISGRTGAGKTELQKQLVSFIDNNKKITLIEDTMDSHIKELYPEKDINSWRTLEEEARANKVSYNHLIKAGLRNNPDWLIIAETRGAEAYDMLESALTDHAIITTIHANGAAAIPSRLLTMIGQEYNVNEILLGKDIANTLKIGIYLSLESRKEGIVRFIREIVEYTDFSEKGIEYNTLYKVNRNFDLEKNDYVEEVKTNPLSNESLEDLKYKGLYHMLPDQFKRESYKQRNVSSQDEIIKPNSKRRKYIGELGGFVK